VLIGVSGHGHFDLAAYDTYLSGSMQDHEHPETAIEEALARLPKA
jgi:tryptophan synthase beta chain